MPQFDSFDQLEDTAEDRAIPVELEGLTLPWLVDGLAIRRASDRHGVEFGDLMNRIQSFVGSDLAKVLDEHGIESHEQYMNLPEEKRKEITAELGPNIGDAAQMPKVVSELLWIGFLRFEPTLTIDEVSAHVGFHNVNDFPIDTLLNRVVAGEDPEAEMSENGEAKKKPTGGG